MAAIIRPRNFMQIHIFHDIIKNCFAYRILQKAEPSIFHMLLRIIYVLWNFPPSHFPFPIKRTKIHGLVVIKKSSIHKASKFVEPMLRATISDENANPKNTLRKRALLWRCLRRRTLDVRSSSTISCVGTLLWIATIRRTITRRRFDEHEGSSRRVRANERGRSSPTSIAHDRPNFACRNGCRARGRDERRAGYSRSIERM